MPNAYEDSEKVFEVLSAFPSPSIRMIADCLGWRGPTHALDTFRVHRALLDLAVDRKVEQVGGRWRVVSGHKHSGTPHP